MEKKRTLSKRKRVMKPRRAPRTMKVQVPLPEVIDYKDIATLKRYLSDRGKILPRRFTSVSARNQRILVAEIKKARFLGLLPCGSAKRK